jgi:NDP-sugar pyrophosphorylase family protein
MPLKPLINVGGQTLIEHVLHAMAGAGVGEIVVIVNEDSVAVRDHVMAQSWPFRLRWIIESTPSSMHSFLRLVETLSSDGDEGPFLLSTVDTVTGPETYARFITQARQFETAVTLALTPPGTDEKPLLVRMVPGGPRIIAIGQAAAPSEYATAGIYAVHPSILREADAARTDGIDALRTFLGRLLDRNYPIAGIPIAASIDVDRPADITAAERFLRAPTI